MDYLAAAGTMLAMDAAYLQVMKRPWGRMIKKIQGREMEVNIMYAMFVYVLMMFALYYFIIKPMRSIYDAALLGIVVYGVFDFTNLALFKEYSFFWGIVDMLWGGLLFATCTYVAQLVYKKRLL